MAVFIVSTALVSGARIRSAIRARKGSSEDREERSFQKELVLYFLETLNVVEGEKHMIGRREAQPAQRPDTGNRPCRVGFHCASPALAKAEVGLSREPALKDTLRDLSVACYNEKPLDLSKS